jgi:hypothetical protein
MSLLQTRPREGVLGLSYITFIYVCMTPAGGERFIIATFQTQSIKYNNYNKVLQDRLCKTTS